MKRKTSKLNAGIENIQYKSKIRAGYIGAFFLLLLSFLLTYYTNRQFFKNAEIVEQSNKTISNLESVLSKVKDAETGFRGFVLYGNEDFLSPYKGAAKAADSIYKETAALLSNNTLQLNRLAAVKIKIDEKFNYISRQLAQIQTFSTNKSVAIPDSFLRSQALMEQIRIDVAFIQNAEKELVTIRDLKLKKTSDALISIVIASIIIAFFLVVFGFITHNKENKEKKDAEQKVKAYQDELNSRINELAKANTELVKMRSQEKLAATGRIARTIAHEIRNPLTNINLAADQLRADLPADDENAIFVFDMISRNSQRINQLISDLLNSTRFSQLNFEKASIHQLLDETIQLAGDRILLNEITLEKKYAARDIMVRVDKERIKIAFLNIIINAIEAMENNTGGRLEIVTLIESGKCSIEIKDNGPGMNAATLENLFEPYFTQKQNGNGLGLTNTQNIVLNHKGDIEVKSEEGKGTVFIITLQAV